MLAHISKDLEDMTDLMLSVNDGKRLCLHSARQKMLLLLLLLSSGVSTSLCNDLILRTSCRLNGLTPVDMNTLKILPELQNPSYVFATVGGHSTLKDCMSHCHWRTCFKNTACTSTNALTSSLRGVAFFSSPDSNL